MKPISLACLLFLFLNVQSQTSKQFLTAFKHKLETYKTLSYNSTIIQTNPFNGDTTIFISNCSFIKNPTDTILGLSYYFVEPDSAFTMFNGNEYYDYHPSYDKSLTHYNIKENPEEFKTVNFSGITVSPKVKQSTFLIYSLFETTKNLLPLVDQLKESEINDTIVEGISCISIKIVDKSSHQLYILNKADTTLFRYIAVVSQGKINLNGTDVNISFYLCVSYTNYKTIFANFTSLTFGRNISSGSFGKEQNSQKAKSLNVGDVAPLWKHPEIKTNKMISLDSLAGKIVLMAITATWCTHCVEGSIAIQEIQQKYSGNEKVVIVSLFTDPTDTRDKILNYCNRNAHKEIVLYNCAEMGKLYGTGGYPNFVIIDRKGKIAYYQRGYSKDLTFRLSQAIDASLKE